MRPEIRPASWCGSCRGTGRRARVTVGQAIGETLGEQHKAAPGGFLNALGAGFKIIMGVLDGV